MIDNILYTIAHLMPLIINSWTGIILTWGCVLGIAFTILSHKPAFSFQSADICKPTIITTWAIVGIVLLFGFGYPFIMPTSMHEFADCIVVFDAFATVILAYFSYVYFIMQSPQAP